MGWKPAVIRKKLHTSLGVDCGGQPGVGIWVETVNVGERGPRVLVKRDGRITFGFRPARPGYGEELDPGANDVIRLRTASLHLAACQLFRAHTISTERASLPFPQTLDPVFDAIEDEMAHVAMVVGPLTVLRLGAARVRRGMKVIS